MPKVIYVHPDGRETEREVPAGTTLMIAATTGDVDGIVGDCGGVMSCATCHVVVDEAFAPRLPPVGDTENQMLDYTAMPRAPTSRLACQIVMSDALDGIRVRIADPQL
jgi:2Fe-2S ferredoxin